MAFVLAGIANTRTGRTLIFRRFDLKITWRRRREKFSHLYEKYSNILVILSLLADYLVKTFEERINLGSIQLLKIN